MNKVLRILNIEDSPRDSELLQAHLERAGYDTVLDRVDTPEGMRKALSSGGWDIIIADYSLPQFSALHALQILKESHLDLPFIITSGTIGEDLAVQAMLAGANDYITKGSLGRLLPAIERELKEAANRLARQEVEEALRASEAELRAIFAAMTDTIIVVDADGRFIRIAGRVPARPPRPPEQLIGMSLHEVYSAEQADFFLGHIRQALKDRQTHRLDYSLQKADLVQWFEATVSPMSDSSVVWIAHEITERKLAEMAFAERTKITALIADVGIALNKPETLMACLQQCADALVHHLDASSAGIWTLNASDQALELMAGAGLRADTDADQSQIEKIASGGKPYFTDQFAGHPLIVNNRVIGVMSLFARQPISVNTAAALAGVADHIALGIERHRAEAELQESEERFRLIANTITEVFWIAEIETGKVVYVSPAYERIWSQTRESLYENPLSFYESIHPDDRRRVMDHLDPRKSGQPFDHEYRILRPDGEIRSIWGRGFPVLAPDGSVKYFVGVAQDITEKLRAEQAVRMAQERMHIALESAKVGVWEADLKTGTWYWSETSEVMHGLDPGTFGRTYEAFLEQVLPADRQQVFQEIQRAIDEHKSAELEYRTILADGSLRKINATGHFTYDEKGLPSRGAGIAVDVTDRRSLEDQFRQAQKMEAVGHLAGGIAHDFNNLLTVINGYAELAIYSLKEENPLRRNLEDIQRAGLRAASLTRQLLAFSRRQVLQPKVLNLNAVISELEKMLARLIGEDVRLKIALNPVGNIKADPGQVEQVIMNLAVNARDAMPTGGMLTIETNDVDLTAEYAHRHIGMRHGPHVMLAISDNGIGMDERTQARIFEPFFTTKQPGKGTGLGLSTAYGIVKQSGGSIWAYSELGKGTTFKIYFPRVTDGATKYKRRVQAKQEFRGTETILLSEDDDSVRSLIATVLRRCGYVVLEAASGKEALSISETHAGKIHLLVTDVIMPGMNGRDLSKLLLERSPSLKVLYISGYTDSVVFDSGLLDESSRFVQKPFTPDTLTSMIREVLDAPIPAKHSS